jgi:hypothetical protein
MACSATAIASGPSEDRYGANSTRPWMDGSIDSWTQAMERSIVPRCSDGVLDQLIEHSSMDSDAGVWVA